MEESDSKTWWERARGTFRNRIITGVVVIVPLVVTFLTMRLVFQWLDSLAQPIIKPVLNTEKDVPGLGIILTFLAVWIAGVFGSNVMGRRVIGHSDDFLARLPIIGSIYSPVKQFMSTLVSSDSSQSFRRVVLAEYPSDGRWILGFATGEVRLTPGGKTGRCVFVPTSPNPATGWMVIFPDEKVLETDLTVEEAMRLIVSGGIVVPESLDHAFNRDNVEVTGPIEFGALSEEDRSQSPPPAAAQSGRGG